MMYREANRINTFSNWPASAPVDSQRIAKAGFFYTGQGTEVECFSCGGKISEWNYGDQVMWRHRTLEPNCAFVVNPGLSGNEPLVLGRECTSVQSAVHGTAADSDQDVQPQDYGLIEEDEMYKSDALRLLSFVNWDDSSVSREELVSAGFYHAGEGRLRCAWCGGELAPFRRFGSLDPPLEVHRMYFPRCAHAAALEAERRNGDASSPLSSPSYTPPLLSPVQSPAPAANAPQSSGAQHNARVMSARSEWRALGVVGGGARHPSRSSLAARLATFERWPADRAQAPRALAAAGFFYTGVDDQVRCFYCDGGLGKWERGDAPWSEHVRWFPDCGYVLLVRGRDFLNTCGKLSQRRALPPIRGTRYDAVNFPVADSQIDECMESAAALAALGAGLDAARVRRALAVRLRTTGTPFTSSEALIDAVLDGQLNEEAWLISPSNRIARDLMTGFMSGSSLLPPSVEEERSDSQASQSDSPIRSPTPSSTHNQSCRQKDQQTQNVNNNQEPESPVSNKELTLEEENRQLKEARMCKVCMDSEVSVVFLPCGHLVSCAGCGAALVMCPLCRAPVKALVRAYLA